VFFFFLLMLFFFCVFFFFFNDTATTEIYTLSLHDALPICSTYPRVEFIWKKGISTNSAQFCIGADTNNQFVGSSPRDIRPSVSFVAMPQSDLESGRFNLKSRGDALGCRPKSFSRVSDHCRHNDRGVRRSRRHSSSWIFANSRAANLNPKSCGQGQPQ